jgi:hypothetical protein
MAEAVTTMNEAGDSAQPPSDGDRLVIPLPKLQVAL